MKASRESHNDDCIGQYLPSDMVVEFCSNSVHERINIVGCCEQNYLKSAYAIMGPINPYANVAFIYDKEDLSEPLFSYWVGTHNDCTIGGKNVNPGLCNEPGCCSEPMSDEYLRCNLHVETCMAMENSKGKRCFNAANLNYKEENNSKYCFMHEYTCTVMEDE